MKSKSIREVYISEARIAVASFTAYFPFSSSFGVQEETTIKQRSSQHTWVPILPPKSARVYQGACPFHASVPSPGKMERAAPTSCLHQHLQHPRLDSHILIVVTTSKLPLMIMSSKPYTEQISGLDNYIWHTFSYLYFLHHKEFCISPFTVKQDIFCVTEPHHRHLTQLPSSNGVIYRKMSITKSQAA